MSNKTKKITVFAIFIIVILLELIFIALNNNYINSTNKEILRIENEITKTKAKTEQIKNEISKHN